MRLLSGMVSIEFSQNITRLRSNAISFEQLLSLNGWILIINALYLIFLDFKTISTDKDKQQLFVLLKNTLPFLAMMPFLIWLFDANYFRDQMSVSDFLGNSMNSLISIIGFNLLGLLFSILSVKVFAHRSSYVNSWGIFMWRLIQAEIENDKLRIFLIYFFSSICFITIWYGVKWERNRAPMAMMMMVAATLIFGFICEKKRIAQKRGRLYGALPISTWQIGIFHLIYPFFGWLSIGILYFLSYFIIQNFSTKILTTPSWLQMLTLNGLILIVNACYLLIRDLRIAFGKKYNRMFLTVFWVLIYLVAVLPFYIMTNSFGTFGENSSLQVYINEMMRSPIWINIVGLILTGFSFYVFLHRKSYLE